MIWTARSHIVFAVLITYTGMPTKKVHIIWTPLRCRTVLYRTGGPNIPVTLKHITGICRKCVNLQLGYCSHCPFMDTEGL